MANITKIYEIKLTGEKELIQQMEQVSNQFDTAKKNFLALKTLLNSGTISGNALTKLQADLQKAALEMLKLEAATKQLNAEAKAYSNALNNQKDAQKQSSQQNEVLGSSYKELLKTVKSLKDELKQKSDVGLDASKIEAITSQVKTLKEGIDGVGGALKSTEKLGGNFNSVIAKSFEEANKSLTEFLTDFLGLKEAFSQIAERAVTFDSLNEGLKTAAKASKDYADNQQFLAELSDRLGTKLLDTTTAFKDYYVVASNAGLSGDKIRQTFADTSTALSALKLGQEGYNATFETFGEILAKGKVDSETFTDALNKRFPQAFETAAKAMGLTTDQLDKMLKSGKSISADEFLPKFATELNKTFGEGEKPVRGLEEELNRLDNVFSEIAQDNRFINALNNIASAVGTVARVLLSIPFGLVITGISALSAAMLYARGVTISEGLAEQWRSDQTLLGLIRSNAQRLGILSNTLAKQANTTATIANTKATVLETETLELATGAQVAFNTAVKANPLGLLLSVIGAVLPLVLAFANSEDDATESIRNNSEALNEVTESTARTKLEIQNMIGILKDEQATHEQKEQALTKLKQIGGEYLVD